MSARRPLSRERVLTTAVALADRDGLTAMTMRALAAELGVEAMSLYHHVPGKDGLLDGLVAQVLAEIAIEIGTGTGPATGTPAVGDWRGAVAGRCLAARRVMLRHPWAPGLIGTRPTVPAGAYALFEGVLAEMVAGGLSYHLGHRGLHALGSMVLGFAAEVFSPDPSGGLDVEAAEADLEAMLAAVPHLAGMVAAELHDHAEDPLGWCDSQEEFEFTLGLILDGLERARAAAD